MATAAVQMVAAASAAREIYIKKGRGNGGLVATVAEAVADEAAMAAAAVAAAVATAA